MKILYVEDDRNVSDIAKRLFLKTNHDFIACEAIADAKRVLLEKYVDVVILDLMFPGGSSGLDLLQFAVENDIKIPVIVYSGYIDYYPEQMLQMYVSRGVVTHVFIKGQNTFMDVIKAVSSVKKTLVH